MAAAPLQNLWDRHERRRNSGTPSISAVVGPITLSRTAIEEWARSLGRPCIEVAVSSVSAEPGSAPKPEREPEPEPNAIALRAGIAAICGGDPEKRLASRWGNRDSAAQTAFEWRTFFQSHDQAIEDSNSDLFDQAARPWLENREAGPPILVAELAQALCDALPSATDRWLAVWDFAPSDRKPIFLRIGGDPQFLADMVERRPSVTAVWLAEPASWSALTDRAPHSRLVALLRESLIVIEPDRAGLEVILDKGAADPQLKLKPDSRSRLISNPDSLKPKNQARDGASAAKPSAGVNVNVNVGVNVNVNVRITPGQGVGAQVRSNTEGLALPFVMKRFGGAADPETERLTREVREAIEARPPNRDDDKGESERDDDDQTRANASARQADDGARSAAERLLFHCLQALPATSGLFQLNEKLDFLFGRQPIEIDLAASSLRLAIELDGYYHFRGPDNYRRDRRKDFELQSRGWLVLRFLADDVALRSESVLETILNAVTRRKSMKL